MKFQKLTAHLKCQSPQLFEVDSHLEEEVLGGPLMLELVTNGGKLTNGSRA